MGNTRLYRLVQGKDLFSREAQYQETCENQFKLDYVEHLRSKETSAQTFFSDTEQNKIATAHKNALSSVVDEIQSTVIMNSQILQLSYSRSLYISKLKEQGFSCPQFSGKRLKQ